MNTRVRTIAIWFAALAPFALNVGTAWGASPSPYVGQEQREIKAMSPEETLALKDGEGMGLARAAELNHYPGPKHVLQLADQLGLSADQRRAATAAYDEMHQRAVALGDQVLKLEQQLESLFSQGKADSRAVEELTTAIGRLQGELRAVHLAAHVSVKAILTQMQVGAYDGLRGYGAAGDHSPAGHMHSH